MFDLGKVIHDKKVPSNITVHCDVMISDIEMSILIVISQWALLAVSYDHCDVIMGHGTYSTNYMISTKSSANYQVSTGDQAYRNHMKTGHNKA